VRATVQLGRPTVLVIHDDGDALDVLTRLFEASGFDVVTAVTGFRAQAHLESDRKTDVVVAPWDLEHGVGGEVYRWSLHRRYDLRDQFVFLASEVPSDFDRIVAGRCLAVSMARPGEVVRVALATIRRAENLELMRDAALAEEANKPTLLLAEDEPILLAIMGDLLRDAGYAVTLVESGNAAIARMDLEDFDAIISDWYMDDGSGADLYRWLATRKPYLTGRVVFLSGHEAEDAQEVAPGRPMVRKGQDSRALLSVISEIIREVRGDKKEEEDAQEAAREEETVVERPPPKAKDDESLPVAVRARAKSEPSG
jgi:CheY-like chemotaxis protein